MDVTPRSPLDWRGTRWFLAIAFGLAWLLDVPIWLSGQGLASPWALLILPRNFTPLLATVLVVRWLSPVPRARQMVGLCRGAPGVPWARYWLAGLLGFTLFNLASPFVGALFGRFPLDLGLSAARAAAQTTPEGTALFAQIGAETYVAAVLATLPLQALPLVPVTLGEEVGWRGYLLLRLLPLGQWWALILSGAIWGLWHAPLILLGFNYPGHPLLGIALTATMGTIIGTLLGWLRLASGSLWPTVLGHAAINANQILGGIMLLAAAGASLDTSQATLLGWTGWLLPLLVIALLAATRRLPVPGLFEHLPAPIPAQAALHGVLASIRDPGLTRVCLTRSGGSANPPAVEPGP
jgi:membrane protease YdiL (CAAX protease family)